MPLTYREIRLQDSADLDVGGVSGGDGLDPDGQAAGGIGHRSAHRRVASAIGGTSRSLLRVVDPHHRAQRADVGHAVTT